MSDDVESIYKLEAAKLCAELNLPFDEYFELIRVAMLKGAEIAITHEIESLK